MSECYIPLSDYAVKNNLLSGRKKNIYWVYCGTSRYVMHNIDQAFRVHARARSSWFKNSRHNSVNQNINEICRGEGWRYSCWDCTTQFSKSLHFDQTIYTWLRYSLREPTSKIHIQAFLRDSLRSLLESIPILDRSLSKMAKIDTYFRTQAAQKSILFKTPHTLIDYIREYLRGNWFHVELILTNNKSCEKKLHLSGAFSNSGSKSQTSLIYCIIISIYYPSEKITSPHFLFF